MTAKAQLVLIHGLGRSRASMNKIKKYFLARDFEVFNAGYNGISNDYAQILKRLENQLLGWVNPSLPLHFVGHSLGGILIRGLLAAQPQWQRRDNPGRCVMLGSPNQGTATADFMQSHRWLSYLTPRVGKELTRDSQLLKSLPEPELQTGIIAGNVDFSLLIPVSWYYKRATENAPGDGVVEIERTKIQNMHDFIIMPLHHSFMTWDSSLVKEVDQFIQHGRFSDKFKGNP